MLSKVLSCWLVLLIAIQSVIAVADAHKVQQVDEAQHVTDHYHPVVAGNHDAQNDGPFASVGGNSGADCVHCCHCHGSAPVSLVNHVQVPHFRLSSPPFGRSRGSTQSHFLPPDLRPPIT